MFIEMYLGSQKYDQMAAQLDLQKLKGMLRDTSWEAKINL